MSEIPGLFLLPRVIARDVDDVQLSRRAYCYRLRGEAEWRCRTYTLTLEGTTAVERTRATVTPETTYGWDVCHRREERFFCALDGVGPAAVGSEQVVAAARSAQHVCALSPRGALRCGSDSSGLLMPVTLAHELGFQVTNLVANRHMICWSTAQHNAHCLPVARRLGSLLAFPAPALDSLVATAELVCGLDANRAVRCWNRFDQAGRANEVAAPVRYAQSLAAGTSHVCAIALDDTLQCWGEESWGRLGPSATYGEPSAIAIHALPGTIRSVRLSSAHTCANLVDGRVYCWGRSGAGETGQQAEIAREPTLAIERLRSHADARRVVLPGPASELETYDGGSCVSLANGRHCWGWGDATPRALTVAPAAWPTSVARPAPSSLCAMDRRLCAFEPRIMEDARVLGVVRGARHSCAWTTRNEVACWGDNRDGQVGDDAVPFAE